MTLTTCPLRATWVLTPGLWPSQYCGAFGPPEVLHNIENEEGLGKNAGNLGIQTDDQQVF